MLLIALCTGVVGISAFGFSEEQQRKYTATANLEFRGHPLSARQIAALATPSGTVSGQPLDEIDLVTRAQISAPSATALGHGLTSARVAQALHVVGGGESNAISISATYRGAALAAAIANTVAQQFAIEQRSSNHQRLISALLSLRRAVSAPTSRLLPDAGALILRRHIPIVQTLLAEHDGDVRIVRNAVPPHSPSYPTTARTTAIGLLLGLLLGIGLAIALARRTLLDPSADRSLTPESSSVGDAALRESHLACMSLSLRDVQQTPSLDVRHREVRCRAPS